MPPIPKKSTIFTMSELYRLDLEDLKNIAKDRKLEFRKSDDKLTFIKVILLSQRVKLKTKKIVSDLEKVSKQAQTHTSNGTSTNSTPIITTESNHALLEIDESAKVENLAGVPFVSCPHCGGRVPVVVKKLQNIPSSARKALPITGPQLKILRVLAEANKALTRERISNILGFKTLAVVRRSLGFGDPKKSAVWEQSPYANGKLCLTTLGYVTEETFDIDGIIERVYEITNSGRELVKEWQHIQYDKKGNVNEEDD